MTFGTRRHWTLVLHVSEKGQKSKVGLSDEAVRLEGEAFTFLGPVLRKWIRNRKADDPLFEFDYPLWAKEFRAAGVSAGLTSIGPPTLHQLRHGGASTDAAAKSRDLPSIQLQGRWKDQRSLVRYAKGGRVTQQMYELTPEVRRKLLRETEDIGKTLWSTFRAM